MQFEYETNANYQTAEYIVSGMLFFFLGVHDFLLEVKNKITNLNENLM